MMTTAVAHPQARIATPARASIAAKVPGALAHTPRRRMPRKLAADLVAMADAVAVMGAFMLPAVIYGGAGGIVSDWRLLIQSGVAAAVIVFMVLRLNGMYAPEKLNDFPLRPGLLLCVLAITMIGLYGHGMPYALRDEHEWLWLGVGLSTGYTLLLMNRAIANPLFAHLTKKGVFDERIAVFGAGNIARRVRDHLEAVPSGIRFAGVFDDRQAGNRVDPQGLEVMGTLADLAVAARNNEIDKIIIALPQSADRRIATIVRKLEALPVTLHVVTHIASDYLDTGPAHSVSAVGTVGLLDVKKKSPSMTGSAS
jgi:FlaA1/EpsC-like NDP-sugar epimerase